MIASSSFLVVISITLVGISILGENNSCVHALITNRVVV
jgi:hypothetical protein